MGRGDRDRRDRDDRGGPQRGRGGGGGGKRVPPEQTHAENYYYRKQMEGKTPMAIVLQDGETILGNIEWYDKGCLKIHRNGEPNLLVFKHSIKYLYKQDRKVEAAAGEDYAEALDEEMDEYEEDVEEEEDEDEDED
jgi:sRNA-binding regulator protein Hfq